MCVQSVLSAPDLLHVPLELLDQHLQFTDALVRFVSCAAKRPGLNKGQTNTNFSLLETFLHKLGCILCTSVMEKTLQKAKYQLHGENDMGNSSRYTVLKTTFLPRLSCDRVSA